MNKLFTLQKKCIRIVSCKTTKINYQFQHTKPMFANLKVLTVFNLFTYFTAVESMKVLRSDAPKAIVKNFTISTITSRLIFPKCKLEATKSRSFIYNGSKILNYLLDNDIPYPAIISEQVFKARLKSHLLFSQSQSRTGDVEWLPCNHSIFSYIRL